MPHGWAWVNLWAMNRRTFLKALAGLPLLGFLAPKPEIGPFMGYTGPDFMRAGESHAALLREYVELQARRPDRLYRQASPPLEVFPSPFGELYVLPPRMKRT